MRTGVSQSLTNSPQFAGIFAGSNAGRTVSAADKGRNSVDFGFQSLGSPNPFLAPLNAIYEEDFLGISYGFRPGRSTHDALDALCVTAARARWAR